MLRALLIASIALAPLPALAQQTSATDASSGRCLLAGKSFSTGATIRAASSVMQCDASGEWTATQSPAAGCFLADNLYSVGATAAVAGSKTVTETCNLDGTWTAKPAS